MAKVWLGMLGPWANDYREHLILFTTKIGDLPDWPIPIDTINFDLLQCSTCANNLSLVAQLCAPLSHHQQRVLFIFVCVSPKCAVTSCRVLRLQKIETPDIDTSQHKQPTEVEIINLENEDESEDEMSFKDLANALIQAGALASSNSKSKSTTQQQRPFNP